MLKEQTQHQLGQPGPPLSRLLSQRCVAPTDARLNRARLAALLLRSPITEHDVWGQTEATNKLRARSKQSNRTPTGDAGLQSMASRKGRTEQSTKAQGQQSTTRATTKGKVGDR